MPNFLLLVNVYMYLLVSDAAVTADEAKVLEQVIRDTEQISLDDEPGVEEEGGGEGGEKGGEGPLIEPGSAIAILEEFITRCCFISTCGCGLWSCDWVWSVVM